MNFAARSPALIASAHFHAESQARAFRNVDHANGRRLEDAMRMLWAEPLAADRLPASVPLHVRATQHDFKRCARCRRVYWPATHRTHMEAEIAALALSPPPGAAHA